MNRARQQPAISAGRIAGKERAILAKYIQFNQPHAIFWLVFDVDRAGAAIDWSNPNAPASW